MTCNTHGCIKSTVMWMDIIHKSPKDAVVIQNSNSRNPNSVIQVQ